MSKILVKYVVAKFRKNILKKFLNIIILIPIFCIIQMFSTAIKIDDFNMKYFISNGNFQKIITSQKNLNLPNSFYQLEGTAGVDKKAEGEAIFKKSKGVKIYLPINDVEVDKTIFNKKNWLSGSFTDLKKSDEGIQVAIDFKTMAKLNLKENDKFILVLQQTSTETKWTNLNCKVKGVLLNSDGNNGIILIGKNSEYESLFKKLNASNISFTSNEVITSKETTVITKSQMLSSSKSEENNIAPNILFPLMGLILTFLIVNKDINFNINRSKKSIAVLSSLGIKYKDLSKALMLYECFDIVIASLFSIIIYKYIIFQKYINIYVVPKFLIYVFIGTVLIGFLAVLLGFFMLNKKLNKMSVIDVLSSKELI